MRLTPTSLGGKLNVWLVAFMLLLAATTTLLILFGFRRTQDDATRRSQEGLETQARTAMLLQAGDSAGIGQLLVTPALLDSASAARYMVEFKQRSGAYPADLARLATTAGGARYDPAPGRASDVWVPASAGGAERDLRDSAALDALLPALLAQEPDAVAAYFISAGGTTRSYPPVGLQEGLAADYEPFGQRGFSEVLPAANPSRLPQFTPPHEDARNGQIVSALAPVYEGDEFRGVVGVDLSLARLVAKADSITVTSSSYSFVIDRRGQLIPGAARGIVEPAIADGSNAAFQRILASMRSGQTSVDRATLDGREVFVAYAPLGVIGGSLAVVAPIDELTEQAGAVRSSIQDEGNRTITFALAVMAGFFVVALLGTAYLSRRVLLGPIGALVKGTRQLAAGNVAAKIPVESEDELGDLAGSFNYMAAEIERRSDALREREEQYRSIFESTSDGLLISTFEGRIVAANRAACAMHGHTYDDFMRLDPGSYIHPDYQHLRREYLETVRAGGDYRIRSRNVRKDGSVFDVDVVGSAFLYGGTMHALALLRDVSDQVAAEEALRERARLSALAAEVGTALTEGLRLEDALQRCAEAIVRQVDAAFARIWLLDDAAMMLELRASAGQYTRLDGDYARIPVNAGRMGRIAKDRETLVSNDAAGSVDILDNEWLEREGLTAFAGYPLVVEEDVVGMMILFARHDLSPATIEALGPVAGAIAIGIRRERAEREVREARDLLEQRVEERTRDIAGLLELSRAVTSKLELRPLVHAILDVLNDAVDCTGSSLMVAEGDALVILESRGPLAASVGGDAAGVRFARGRMEGFWDVIARGERVSVGDVRGDSSEAKRYRRILGDLAATPAFRHVRAWLAIPLIHQDRVIGMLSLSRDEPDSFTERHERMAGAIAAQAAVAIENARLFEQTEQRTRELATLLDVARNVASTIELEPLLHLVLEQTRAVVDYENGAVFLRDGDELEVIALHARTPELERQLRASQIGMRFLIRENEIVWSMVQRGEHVIIDDIHADTRLAASYRRAVTPELLPHVGSWLGVPLMLKDEVSGMLALTNAGTGYFTARHGQLASAIAAQAAVAIENARLFAEAQRRARETEALMGADAELFRSLSLDTVLQALVDVAVDTLGADKSLVALHEGDVDVIRATRNYSQETLAAIAAFLATSPHEEPDAGEAKPRVYNDVRTAPEFAARTLAAENIASHLSIPVRHGLRMLGAFSVSFREPHVFSDEEQRLYVALADRAAVAIQNAELYERAQQAASLEERQRLARELHDSVSQALYGIALGARTASALLDRDPARAREPIDYVLSLAEAGLAEMRSLIFELRPESLEAEGLVAALEKQIAATRARYGIEVEATLGAEPAAPPAVREAVYRIAQEALHNVVKHAQATKVGLTLSSNERQVELEVRDNGSGFDAAGEFPGHLGLRSMRERATRLGGELSIRSGRRSGTRVRLRIPW